MLIKVREITGAYAISADNGQQLYDQIHGALLETRSVELDFSGVSVFTSAFFNFAIGQLLKDISAEDLNRCLIITALDQNGEPILRHTITNAKRYYSDLQYQEAINTVLEEYATNFEV